MYVKENLDGVEWEWGSLEVPHSWRCFFRTCCTVPTPWAMVRCFLLSIDDIDSSPTRLRRIPCLWRAWGSDILSGSCFWRGRTTCMYPGWEPAKVAECPLEAGQRGWWWCLASDICCISGQATSESSAFLGSRGQSHAWGLAHSHPTLLGGFSPQPPHTSRLISQILCSH